MSDRPQGDEIDQELRSAMSDIAAVPEPAPEFDELFSPTLTLEGERTMRSNTRNMLIAAAAAVVALIVGVLILAPGDDRDLDTIEPPDESSTTLPDQEDASGGVDAPSVEDLFGVWLTTRGGVWTISEGAIAVNGGYADEFTYTASDATIALVDAVCGTDKPGTYEWTIEGDEFALTLVTDECSWRPADLDGVRFQRVGSEGQSADDLLGVWLSSQRGLESGVWTISEGAIVVEGRGDDDFTYTATDATIELVDADCGPDAPGTYEWAMAGDLFGLTLLSDECGVGTDLDGVTFQRVELEEQRAEDLLGVWQADEGATWRILESGILVEGGPISSLTYTATDTTIEVVDGDCGADRPGTYAWVIAGDVLGLTLVSDDCNRADNLSGRRFQRVVE